MSAMGLCALGENEDDTEQRVANTFARMGNMAATEDAQAAFRASPAIGTIDQLVDRFKAYEEVGVDRVYLQLIDRTDLEAVALMGRLAAALR